LDDASVFFIQSEGSSCVERATEVEEESDNNEQQHLTARSKYSELCSRFDTKNNNDPPSVLFWFATKQTHHSGCHRRILLDDLVAVLMLAS
jgi:hypothetical protein